VVFSPRYKSALLFGGAALHCADRCFHTTVRAGRDLVLGVCIVFTFRCQCRRANEASGREGLNYMHTKMKDILA
jgi:hypothetical protein